MKNLHKERIEAFDKQFPYSWYEFAEDLSGPTERNRSEELKSFLLKTINLTIDACIESLPEVKMHIESESYFDGKEDYHKEALQRLLAMRNDVCN